MASVNINALETLNQDQLLKKIVVGYVDMYVSEAQREKGLKKNVLNCAIYLQNRRRKNMERPLICQLRSLC